MFKLAADVDVGDVSLFFVQHLDIFNESLVEIPKIREIFLVTIVVPKSSLVNQQSTDKIINQRVFSLWNSSFES